MSTITSTKPMTADELLMLPDDGVDRELIRGELRERPMTRRNRWHGQTEANLSFLLKDWHRQQSAPIGKVYAGEVGCILQRDPDTAVGVDVAFVAAATVARQTDETTMIDGPPLLAVEILSPSDKQEEILDKVGEYLAAGVGLVWVVEPRFRTVTVYRHDAEPELFNVRQELSAEPHLPGFRVSVAAIFE